MAIHDGQITCTHTLRLPAFQTFAAVLLQPNHTRQFRICASQRQRAQLAAPSALSFCREYRRNVGICLVNKTGLVFAARRVDDTQGTWQMPQGGIDALENPFAAATRELLEETGISSVMFLAQIDEWLEYEFPTTVKCNLTGTWTKYKGQTQKWMLYKFMGQESEIDLDYADKEFLEYKWAELDELPEAVVHFKQNVYRHVAQKFLPYIQAIKSGCDSSGR